jgi:hypothetical protein
LPLVKSLAMLVATPAAPKTLAIWLNVCVWLPGTSAIPLGAATASSAPATMPSVAPFWLDWTTP